MVELPASCTKHSQFPSPSIVVPRLSHCELLRDVAIFPLFLPAPVPLGIPPPVDFLLPYPPRITSRAFTEGGGGGTTTSRTISLRGFHFRESRKLNTRILSRKRKRPDKNIHDQTPCPHSGQTQKPTSHPVANALKICISLKRLRSEVRKKALLEIQ